MTSRREKFFFGAALLGLLAAGGMLRFYRLGEKSLWWDEVRTIEVTAAPGFQERFPVETLIDPAPELDPYYFSLSFRETLKTLRKETPHPPLFYCLMWPWMRLSGFSEEGMLHVPLALLGTLAILGVFVLGVELHSWELGGIAASLAALSPFQIYFSQELRHYTLLTLLILLSYLSFLRLLRAEKGWTLFSLGVSLAAALYTHYAAFLVVPAQGLTLVASAKARLHWRRWVKAMGLTALLVVGYIPQSLIVQRKAAESVWLWEGSLLPQLLESFFSLPIKLVFGPNVGGFFYALSGAEKIFWGMGGMLWIAVWSYGLTRLISSEPVHRDSLWFLICWIVVPVGCIVGLDLVRHSVVLSVSRYFSWTTPPLMLLLALGILGLQRPLRWLLTSVLLGTMSFLLVSYYQDPVRQQDWKGLSFFLKSHAESRDLLVLNQIGRPEWVAPLNTLCLTYYHGTEGHPLYLTSGSLSPKAEELLRREKRFWLIPQTRFFKEPGPPFRRLIQREFQGIGAVALFEKER